MKNGLCVQFLSDVGYTDNGEECRTSCSKTHDDITETYNWCWTKAAWTNDSSAWDYCTPDYAGMLAFKTF